MAQEKPNRLVEWYQLLRRQAPVARQHVVDWGEAVREEPSLLWSTPAVRYLVYIVGGFILVWSVGWVTHALTPPPPPDAQAQATTADFHVLCTNPNCRTHFAIRRSFGFDDFPVQCPACAQVAGEAARSCPSPTCKGRWVVPVKREGLWRCPVCDTQFP